MNDIEQDRLAEYAEDSRPVSRKHVRGCGFAEGRCDCGKVQYCEDAFCDRSTELECANCGQARCKEHLEGWTEGEMLCWPCYKERCKLERAADEANLNQPDDYAASSEAEVGA